MTSKAQFLKGLLSKKKNKKIKNKTIQLNTASIIQN